MKSKSLQNSVSKRGTVFESFFVSFEPVRVPFLVSCSLSALVKPFQKAFWACKIVYGTFFAAAILR